MNSSLSPFFCKDFGEIFRKTIIVFFTDNKLIIASILYGLFMSLLFLLLATSLFISIFSFNVYSLILSPVIYIVVSSFGGMYMSSLAISYLKYKETNSLVGLSDLAKIAWKNFVVYFWIMWNSLKYFWIYLGLIIAGLVFLFIAIYNDKGSYILFGSLFILTGVIGMIIKFLGIIFSFYISIRESKSPEESLALSLKITKGKTGKIFLYMLLFSLICGVVMGLIQGLIGKVLFFEYINVLISSIYGGIFVVFMYILYIHHYGIYEQQK